MEKLPKEPGMLSKSQLMQLNNADTYRIHLAGTMQPGPVDWYCEIAIDSLEHRDTLLVSILMDPASLRNFLSQFVSLDLSVEPIEHSISDYPELCNKTNLILAESRERPADQLFLHSSPICTTEVPNE
jgi:hypothetical protein